MKTTEGHVSVDEGVELFFRKAGEGPDTLIVLNGFYLFDDFAYLAEGRTVIFLDLRNRGRSSSITDPEKLKRGVLNDIDDLDAVRRHFGVDRVDLLGTRMPGRRWFSTRSNIRSTRAASCRSARCSRTRARSIRRS